MGNKSFFKPKKITLIKQYYIIESKYRNLIIEKQRDLNSATFDFNIIPSELSQAYTVRMVLSKNNNPKIYVLHPKIKTRKKKRPPHIYDFDEGRICLFLPREINSYSCYDKIVPWIAEWLLFYEIWLVTGNWNGGGHILDVKKDKKLLD